jgi:hypothetical protein
MWGVEPVVTRSLCVLRCGHRAQLGVRRPEIWAQRRHLWSTNTSWFANYSVTLQLANEKSGVDCVQHDEKKVCSCHNIRKVGTILFFARLRIESTSDFPTVSCSGTPWFATSSLVCKTRHVTCVYSKDVASVFISPCTKIWTNAQGVNFAGTKS